jgi:hypothetical protein
MSKVSPLSFYMPQFNLFFSHLFTFCLRIKLFLNLLVHTADLLGPTLAFFLCCVSSLSCFTFLIIHSLAAGILALHHHPTQHHRQSTTGNNKTWVCQNLLQYSECPGTGQRAQVYQKPLWKTVLSYFS